MKRSPTVESLALFFSLLMMTAPGTAQTATVGTGTSSHTVAVNPVTNKIYVVNQNGGNVTVIDGATNATATVTAGASPVAVAVNPVTNKIYVVNSGSYSVTVIDGATNTATTVVVGSYPQAVAVNPVTNKIYVANGIANNVTVIDGATNATTTVTTGTCPRDVAISPVTNKIYVVNSCSANVTVIDGLTNATTTVAVGSDAWVVAVNPVTNKIYVANGTANNVTVIDGVSNSTTTVTPVTDATGVAVNPVTNKIYVVNSSTAGGVAVIDGATNSTITVPVGTYSVAVAVNPVTNKIYVASSDNITVIDGATAATTTVFAVISPVAVAVNPVTNEIYVVVDSGSHSFTVVIDGATNTATIVAVAQNAASYATGAVSPGEVVVLYGAGMGPASLATLQVDSASGLLETTVAGTTVLFNGIPAPIVYTSTGQVSVIVPYEVANAATAQVLVSYLGSHMPRRAGRGGRRRTNVAAGTVTVAPSAPGLFTVNSGTGQAAALNQDGSVNSASNPAAAGSTIVLYLTGEGQTTPPGVDGKVASAAPLPAPVLPVRVMIGGQPATYSYAGAAPGEVAGVMQINAIIPEGLAGNAVPVSVQVGTVSTQNSVTVAVQ